MSHDVKSTCPVCKETGHIRDGWPCWCKRKENAINRLKKKSKIDPVTGCWIYTGPLDRKGYAMSALKTKERKESRGHRVSYIVFRGRIPKNKTVDHRCRKRNCVNPRHLRLLSGVRNVMIGFGPSAINARKTHCIRGHPLIEGNIYSYKGGRHCRTCAIRRSNPDATPWLDANGNVRAKVVQRGEDNRCAKLTEAQVLEIRAKYCRNVYGVWRLAKEYGIHRHSIRMILRRQTWKHI